MAASKEEIGDWEQATIKVGPEDPKKAALFAAVMDEVDSKTLKSLRVSSALPDMRGPTVDPQTKQEKKRAEVHWGVAFMYHNCEQRGKALWLTEAGAMGGEQVEITSENFIELALRRQTARAAARRSAAERDEAAAIEREEARLAELDKEQRARGRWCPLSISRYLPHLPRGSRGASEAWTEIKTAGAVFGKITRGNHYPTFERDVVHPVWIRGISREKVGLMINGELWLDAQLLTELVLCKGDEVYLYPRIAMGPKIQLTELRGVVPLKSADRVHHLLNGEPGIKIPSLEGPATWEAAGKKIEVGKMHWVSHKIEEVNAILKAAQGQVGEFKSSHLWPGDATS